MTAPVGRLLVVAPHATRSGSTSVLLALLGIVAERGSVPVAVELLTGGPQAGALQAFGPPLRRGEAPAAVLVNSAIGASTLERFGHAVPAAIYLHESAEVLSTLTPMALAQLRRCQLVLCVSDQIAAGAVAHGVDAASVRVVPPMIRPAAVPSPEAVADARAAVGVRPGERLVLGCGEARWVKGADLFVEVAAQLRADPTIRFAWVGRRVRSFGRQLDHDAQRLGIADRLRWLGEVGDVAPYLAAADVVVAPSRDDAQPLVPLEAALHGTPTVAFGVGGLRDLAEAGAALTCPYPDVRALAALARTVLAEPDLGVPVVAAAQQRIATRQSPEVVGPQFLALIDELVAGVTGSEAPR